jgi:ArsR family transcriptional regulator, arsenate/arsenite/antimonite-responsive transcriptional repressor
MSTNTLPELTRAARWFHALSDETRLRVIDMLRGGEKCVCDLQDAVGAAQSRLSFHLKVLRDSGLVSDRKQGRWVHYSLRPEVLEAMAGYLEQRRPEPTAVGGCACGDDVASRHGCCG